MRPAPRSPPRRAGYACSACANSRCIAAHDRLVAVMAVSAMYLVAIRHFRVDHRSVDRLADGIAGIAALEVSGITDAGFPDTITADVAAVPGVATAAPMIRTSASTRPARCCCSAPTRAALRWVAR